MASQTTMESLLARIQDLEAAASRTPPPTRSNTSISQIPIRIESFKLQLEAEPGSSEAVHSFAAWEAGVRTYLSQLGSRATSLLEFPPSDSKDGPAGIEAAKKLDGHVLFALMSTVPKGTARQGVARCTTAAEAWTQLQELYIGAKNVLLQQFEEEFSSMSCDNGDPRTTLHRLLTLQSTLETWGCNVPDSRVIGRMIAILPR